MKKGFFGLVALFVSLVLFYGCTTDDEPKITGGNTTTFTLTVTDSGSGATSILPEQATYDSGYPVQLLAIADSGYKFSHWSGTYTDTANPAIIMMVEDVALTAHFIDDTATVVIPDTGDTVEIPGDTGAYIDQIDLSIAKAEIVLGTVLEPWYGMGDTIPIAVVLQNSGYKNALSVRTTLSTNDPLIKITNEQMDYNNVDTNGINYALDPFYFYLKVPFGYDSTKITRFYMKMIDSWGGEWNDSFDMQFNSVVLDSLVIDDDDIPQSDGDDNASLGRADTTINEIVEFTPRLMSYDTADLKGSSAKLYVVGGMSPDFLEPAVEGVVELVDAGNHEWSYGRSGTIEPGVEAYPLFDYVLNMPDTSVYDTINIEVILDSTTTYDTTVSNSTTISGADTSVTYDTTITSETEIFPVDTIYTIDTFVVNVEDSEVPVIMVIKGDTEEDGQVLRIVRFMAPATPSTR